MWRFARDPIKSERMKKPLAILAVVLLCLLAGLGGVTLAIGPAGLLEMAGLGGEETAEERESLFRALSDGVRVRFPEAA